LLIILNWILAGVVSSEAIPVGAAAIVSQVATESEAFNNAQGEQVSDGRFRDPGEIKRNARVLYIKSRTGFLKHAALADALEKREDFQELGLVITENEIAADIIIEIEREHMLAHFTYTAYDPGTRTVVASGHVSSLFGTAAGKIADSFVKQMKRARTPRPQNPRK
jgi:hypothetical protein